MNQRYQKNLRVIKQNLPFIYDKLVDDRDQYSITVQPLNDFKNALFHMGDTRCYANSLYNPEKEMSRYFEQMDAKTQTILILGAGSGMVLEHISRNFPNVERVIVVEPSLEVFKYSLENANYEKYFSKFGMTLIVNNSLPQTADLMSEVIEERMNGGIHVVTQHSFATLFREFFVEISDVMMRSLRRQLSQVSTSHHITYLRVVNVMTNLKTNALSAAALIPLFKECPVFVVSAGPSLEKDIALLESAKQKGIVIGVGTAIEILDQKGIQPHFRAAFSPHVDTTIFKKLNDDTVPLIYLDTLYHDILGTYSGAMLKLVSNGDTLTRYAMSHMGIPNHELVTEMSIANIVIEFCLQIGVPKLILLGQDMAYTDMKLYADGSLENMKVQEQQTNLIREKGYDGEIVYTDIRFMSMRDSIVRSILRNAEGKALSVVNCSEGGLMIPLTSHTSLQELLLEMVDSEDLETKISERLQGSLFFNDEEYKSHMTDFVEHLRTQVSEMEVINEERVEMVTARIRERESGKSAENILKKYGTVNSFEERLQKVPIYNEVIQYEFDGIFKAIIQAFKYQGSNSTRQVEAVENMVVRVCLEMRKIINAFKMLIDEYYGIEYPVGVGNPNELPEILRDAIGGADFCLVEPVKERMH